MSVQNCEGSGILPDLQDDKLTWMLTEALRLLGHRQNFITHGKSSSQTSHLSQLSFPLLQQRAALQESNTAWGNHYFYSGKQACSFPRETLPFIFPCCEHNHEKWPRERTVKTLLAFLEYSARTHVCSGPMISCLSQSALSTVGFSLWGLSGLWIEKTGSKMRLPLSRIQSRSLPTPD